MTLDVFDIGSAVKFGQHDAIVLRLQIGPQLAVMYEIGFWGGSAKLDWLEMWVQAFMLSACSACSAERLKIGFQGVQ